MDLRTFLAASAALLIPLGALAASDTTPPSGEARQDSPESTPPGGTASGATAPGGTPPEGTPQPAADPYAELNKRVQEKLQARGLYDGPISGEFGYNTQAALAQFQLSVPMPVNGMLDDPTLAALGIELEDSADSPSAGASPAAEREAADPASTGPAAAR